ncbi:MAG: DUF1858 domain-containing protein [Marinilabiliales bacterium]|nr:MAG: DUF1858 domain-containing protein [Marinilabiliales bacterium]
MIRPDIDVEELIEVKPEAVDYLRKKGIVCVLCGEPVWGTLEELATEKGFSKSEIDQIINELNALPLK